MNAYYRVTQKLKELLLEDEDINTVTKGDPTQMDANKKNIFPLAHINIINAVPTSTTIKFQVAVFAMDLRDHNNIIETDKFVGNDNEDDNMNSMLYVLVRLFLRLSKQEEHFVANNVQPFIPYLQKRSNILDGWMMLFDVELPLEEISSC